MSFSHVKKLDFGRIVSLILLGVAIAITVLPVWMVLRTALTDPRSLFQDTTSLLPASPTLINFQRVLGLLSETENMELGGLGAEVNFPLAFFNSVVFTLIVVAGQVIFSAMAAYAFARLRFRGRDLIFGAIVCSMLVPPIVLYIPNFLLVKDMGMLNTMQGLVSPYVLISAFNIFFLRQFFLSLPRDIEEAAMIDGASYAYIFWRMVLPLSATPLVTISILTGIAAWNEFFWPFLVGKEDGIQVLTVALQAFKSQTQQGSPDWTGLMAATFLTIIPTVALLLFMGKRVVESVQFSGGK